MSDLERISEIVIRLAREKILPRFKNLAEGDISAKSPGDLVTIADIETEQALSEELLAMFPAAVVAGEEVIAAKPDLLQGVITAEQGFLIDPVDGTNNFVKGDQKFALMLTELRKGEAVAAWIYLPVSDEITMAEKGAGAFIDGKRIKLAARKFDPEKMIAAAHINRFPEKLKLMARENIKKFSRNRPAFCAGYDYIALTKGLKDFSIYYRTLPWDHLPGSLIFSEAGGYVRSLLDGETYTIHDKNKGLLSAVSKDQWYSIREMVFPGCFQDK
ncbi:MAG: inositol monophosphatase [Alphaproteobacteria bacterium]|nr:MAG: inositol monophosphatase [Alphaproteobacteria bacterium]